MGSIDIDLIVDPDIVDNNEYQTIVELIRQSGWNQVSGKQFTFARAVRGKDSVVRDMTVDFLTLQKKDRSKEHRRNLAVLAVLSY